MDERNYWSRQILGSSCFQQVASSKVLMIGAGGIGCELLKNLVLSGFSNIQIVIIPLISRILFSLFQATTLKGTSPTFSISFFLVSEFNSKLKSHPPTFTHHNRNLLFHLPLPGGLGHDRFVQSQSTILISKASHLEIQSPCCQGICSPI